MQQSINIIAYSIAIVLPCRYCRESYRRFIQYIDIRQWLQEPISGQNLTTGDFEYWLYLMHNMVNQKLRRKWERNKDAVYGGRVIEEERGFMNNLFDWCFILLMNYEPLEKKDAAVLKKVGKYALKKGTDWIENANKYNVTLGALLDAQIFDKLYEHDLCQGGTQLVALSQTRWRKSCWYVFHFANLVKTLQAVSNFSEKAKKALSLMEHYFVERADESFIDNRAAFARLYQVRCQYDPTCPTFDQTMERIESYKASDKSRDTSSAAENSAKQKKDH